MRLLHVVGARPNIMKASAVIRAGDAAGLSQVLVHTGQHYDASMSDVFFRDLALRNPDVHLGVGQGSHAEQTAKVMLGLEPVLRAEAPDWVMVYGDVNSTVASALCAAKLGVPVAHVEAGLRSFDRAMPEELNRIVVDQLADLLFTHSPEADENLLAERRPRRSIRRVGNVMIDALDRCLPGARARDALGRFHLGRRDYAILTLHRPSNVDEPETLARLLSLVGVASAQLPVLFPVHPRTRARLEAVSLPRGLRTVEPLGYLDFIALLDGARFALTDSGGVQEETTALGVPCLTLRDNTERPITVEEGTNRLVGHDAERLREGVAAAIASPGPAPDRAVKRPAFWDGRAGERIVATLLEG